MTAEHIGDLLVERDVLTRSQVRQALTRQRREERPFGILVEEMFAVPVAQTAMALAEQIAADCPPVDLCREHLEEGCLSFIRPRDAWESLVLPMRIENGELLCATTVGSLPNAIELVQRSVPLPFRFMIADIRLLEQFIAERYDFEGIEISEEPTDPAL